MSTTGTRADVTFWSLSFVSAFASQWRRRFALAFACFVVTACDANPLAVPTSDVPLVYAILAIDSMLPGDSVVSALVATAGTPTVATYRSVERFTMSRVRDGASFAWRVDPPTSERIQIAPLSSAVPVRGNVVLARISSNSGLGRDSLQGGESYSFNVQTQGVTLTGTVTIPIRPQPTRILRGGQEVIVWPRTAGAGRYLIIAETERAPSFTLRDTEYVLKRDRSANEVPANPRLILTAIDSNLTRFLTDQKSRAAGVVGGYGVFGAMSTGQIPLPPPMPPTASATPPPPSSPIRLPPPPGS